MIDLSALNETDRAEVEAELALDNSQSPDAGIPRSEFQAQQEALKELAQRELCRRRLLPFIMKANPAYEPGWVHKEICERMEAFEKRVRHCLKNRIPGPRMMISMPPRLGKSEIASRCAPPWLLGRNPEWEIIATSYSAGLALKFSRRARSLVKSPLFRSLFPHVELDPDAQGVENWLTLQGGGYMAAGVSGPLTGSGMHVGMIDDPVKNREEAESETVRESIKDWYSSTFYTRLAPGGGIIVIQTRWHDDDLSGWLEAEMRRGGDEFELLKYPAIAEKDERHRKKGEPLHPERFNIETLEKIKRAIGPRDWNALYQQNPVAAEGEYFTKSMLRYYRTAELPDDSQMTNYTSWDLAVGKRDANDFSVGLTVSVDERGRIFLRDLVRRRMDAYELVEKILDQWELWGDDVVGIEKSLIEMSIEPYLEKRIEERGLWGFPYEKLKTGKQDKQARARSIQGRMRQGMVFFPEDAAWTQELVNELLRFPSGVHDDQVDALAWIGVMMNIYHVSRAREESSEPKWMKRLQEKLGNQHVSAMSS